MICFDVHTHIIRVDNRSIFNLILKEDSLAIPEAFFSSGIHPWYITDNWRMILEDHFQKDYKQRVAIGETGIDMLKGANIKLQEMVFMAHIEWALNLKMPLVIHSVRSSQRIIEILRDMKFQFPVVIHGFRQGMEVAKKFLSEGYYLSLGVYVDHAWQKLTEAIRYIPFDRILIESDDYDGDCCEIYQQIAHIKGISADELDNRILLNVKKCFQKIDEKLA